jgi:DNA gyrase subunit A
MVFLFENGKGVRVPVSSYVTKSNRRKLTGACSSASPLVAVFCEKKGEPLDILLISSAYRAILIKSSLIPLMATRTSGGNQLMTLKKGQTVTEACIDFDGRFQNVKSYRKLKLPAAGTLLEEKDINIQQMKIEE